MTRTDLSADLTSADWRDQAACRSTPTVLFFPSRGDDMGLAVARRICSGCRVRAECLDYALELGERYGVWGGKLEKQRSRLRRRSTVAPPAYVSS